MGYYVAHGAGPAAVPIREPRRFGLGQVEVVAGAGAQAATPVLLEVAGYLGPVAKAATGVVNVLQAPSEGAKVTAGVTAAASIALSFVPYVGPALALITSLLGGYIGGLFKPELSHKQRELLETARYGESWVQMYHQILGADTYEKLFNVVVRWTRGTPGVAVIVTVGPQKVSALKDAEEFWRLLLAEPQSVSVSVQAGISESYKSGPNHALRDAILYQAQKIYRLEVDRLREEILTGVKGMETGVATVNPEKVIQAMSQIPTSGPFEARKYLTPTALARVGTHWIVAPPGVVTELTPGVRYVPAELHEQITKGLVGWRIA